MIKVSVILPVYNIENYVSKCLDSVINQTLKDIEIICINDCSSDSSKDIVLEYAKKDKRIKLINHEENQGLGFARNTGIINSQSDYLVFIDPDDYVSYNFVEELYDTSVKYGADMVFTNNMYTVNEKSGKIKPFYHNRINIWKKDFKNNWKEGISRFNVNTPEKENTPEYPLVSAVNKIFRKKFLEDHKLLFSKYRIAEDVDFFYRFLVHDPIMYYNNNAEYYYLQRSTSLAGSVHTAKKIPIAILDVFENVFKYYKENRNELLIDSNYYNFFSFLHTFNNYKADNKNEFYKKCHELMKALNPEIDRKKHAFYAYSMYIMKTYDDYNVYLEKIESIKKKVFDIAWWIPSLTLREKYRNANLDKLAEKNWK